MQCPSRSLKYSPGRGALFLANLNESVSTKHDALKATFLSYFLNRKKKVISPDPSASSRVDVSV